MRPEIQQEARTFEMLDANQDMPQVQEPQGAFGGISIKVTPKEEALLNETGDSPAGVTTDMANLSVDSLANLQESQSKTQL